MADQDTNQNLPVEEESSGDPVRLPETIKGGEAETPSVIPSEASPRAGEVEESSGGDPSPRVLRPSRSETTPLRSAQDDGQRTEPEEEEAAEKAVAAVPANVFDDGTPGHWYVLHTYSGYEDAVAESLKQRIESLDMKDKIFHILVPKEKQIEIKNGKRRTVEKKIFPGYVLVKMVVTEASWYVVRNTPSVTGFIGSGTIPVPISDAEMETIKKRMIVEEPKHKIDLKIGDLVHITDGPFKEYDGTVSEVDEAKGKIKVLVSIFGRETPVELDFLQVKRA